jgi:hypothetical protein
MAAARPNHHQKSSGFVSYRLLKPLYKSIAAFVFCKQNACDILGRSYKLRPVGVFCSIAQLGNRSKIFMTGNLIAHTIVDLVKHH